MLTYSPSLSPYCQHWALYGSKTCRALLKRALPREWTKQRARSRSTQPLSWTKSLSPKFFLSWETWKTSISIHCKHNSSHHAEFPEWTSPRNPQTNFLWLGWFGLVLVLWLWSTQSAQGSHLALCSLLKVLGHGVNTGRLCTWMACTLPYLLTLSPDLSKNHQTNSE